MNEKQQIRRRLRTILVISGTVSLSLGLIGIFVPLLPTTPFLLLAAACYARSSPRFYKWLLSNKYLGTYIENYRSKKGVPLKVKIFTATLLWTTIGASIIFAANDNLIVQLILVAIATGVTAHILSLKTLK